MTAPGPEAEPPAATPAVRPGATVFHLALTEEWQAARDAGEYRRSTRGLSLEEVGFVHCSTRDQVVPTRSRFYADVDDLLLLEVDPTGLDLRWEPVGAELFPHLYGPVPLAAVVGVETLAPLS